MSHSLPDDDVLQQLALAARRHRAEDQESPRGEEELDRRTDELMAAQGEEAFGGEFQATVLGAIRGRLEAEPKVQEPLQAAVGPVPRWKPPVVLLAASVILALTLGYWFQSALNSEAGVALLPIYQIELDGLAAHRSESDSPARKEVVPGFRFEIRLRPEKQTMVTPQVQIFASREKGELLRWLDAETLTQVMPSGVVLLEGLGPQDWQPLEPGDWTIYFVLGHRGKLPSQQELGLFLASSLPRKAEPRKAAPEGDPSEGEAVHPLGPQVDQVSAKAPSWQLLSQEIRLLPFP